MNMRIFEVVPIIKLQNDIINYLNNSYTVNNEV